MTSLLQRFVDPTAGRITIDGQDIAELTRARVRSKLAVVTQDPWLFTGTAGENIDFGTHDGDVPPVFHSSGLLALCSLFAGCVSIPKPLAGDYPATQPRDASASGRIGERVRWGGIIIAVEPEAARVEQGVLVVVVPAGTPSRRHARTVGRDDIARQGHRVGPGPPGLDDAVLGLDPHDPARRGARAHRY